MAIRMTKPWTPIDVALTRLHGQVGVYQLANEEQVVIYIGFAGGRSLFGLKGEVAAQAAAQSDARFVRVEITTSYTTRYRELLMVHIADHGESPVNNPPMRLGRLSPA